jgi:hypothetical protein
MSQVDSNCVSAAETRQAYLDLAESGACSREDQPCLRDECEACRALNELIDQRGDECEKRGCTMLACIFDSQPAPSA